MAISGQPFPDGLFLCPIFRTAQEIRSRPILSAFPVLFPIMDNHSLHQTALRHQVGHLLAKEVTELVTGNTNIGHSSKLVDVICSALLGCRYSSDIFSESERQGIHGTEV